MSSYIIVKDGYLCHDKCIQMPSARMKPLEDEDRYTPYGYIVPNDLEGMGIVDYLDTGNGTGFASGNGSRLIWILDHKGNLNQIAIDVTQHTGIRNTRRLYKTCLSFPFVLGEYSHQEKYIDALLGYGASLIEIEELLIKQTHTSKMRCIKISEITAKLKELEYTKAIPVLAASQKLTVYEG